jgi:hypothetical protein
MSSTTSTCQDPHHPGGRGAGPVRRDRHELQRHRHGHRPGQVGHHHDRALEHSDEDDLAPGVVGVDLGGELTDLLGDLLFRDQHRLDVRMQIRGLFGH